ncbi:MAG TPA: hypothetical protein VKX46_17160, partial [Ktedonobacteraceae bacterium]|nr:hypothetical protein [Ktedonobacteraceae bacterium]
YMKVLVETGAVGMLLFVLVLAKCFSVAARLRRVAQDPFASGLALGLLSLLGCLVIVNIFGDRWTYIEINGVVWILLAVAARAYAIQTESEPEVAATAEEDSLLPEAQLDPEEAAWLEWQHRRAEAVPEI